MGRGPAAAEARGLSHSARERAGFVMALSLQLGILLGSQVSLGLVQAA
jgi:hypothetical protein